MPHGFAVDRTFCDSRVCRWWWHRGLFYYQIREKYHWVEGQVCGIVNCVCMNTKRVMWVMDWSKWMMNRRSAWLVASPHVSSFLAGFLLWSPCSVINDNFKGNLWYVQDCSGPMETQRVGCLEQQTMAAYVAFLWDSFPFTDPFL